MEFITVTKNIGKMTFSEFKRLSDTKEAVELKELPRVKRHVKIMSNNRIVYMHTCKCGNKFEGIKTAIYCSEACKQKAKREKKSKNVSKIKS